MEIFTIMFKELEENPSLARKLLLGLWFQRRTQMPRPCADCEVDSMMKVMLEWIFARRPLSRKAAEKILRQQPDDDFDRLLVRQWAGKRGRPITKRQAAIEALFRREYLHKSWMEVTSRVCPCGHPHTRERVSLQCQPALQAEVRHLKRVLRDCKIDWLLPLYSPFEI